MKYIEFDKGREFDLILMGRVTIDLNPMDYYKTLAESETYKKYLGGSPANIAVGLARLGKKVGFISRVRKKEWILSISAERRTARSLDLHLLKF